MIKRVIFDVILFISAFILPWWVVVVMLFIGIFIFSNFYEFIIISTIIYSLYSIPGDKVIYSPMFFSLISIVLYVSIQAVKNNIILYKYDI